MAEYRVKDYEVEWSFYLDIHKDFCVTIDVSFNPENDAFEEFIFHVYYEDYQTLFFKIDPDEKKFVFVIGAFVEDQVLSIPKEDEEKINRTYFELLKEIKKDTSIYGKKFEEFLDDDFKKIWEIA